MSYEYQKERPYLFTDEGQRMFLTIRDETFRLCGLAGAARVDKAWARTSGSTWQQLACFDRMVELGEIEEITHPDTMGQYRVFRKVERTA